MKIIFLVLIHNAHAELFSKIMGYSVDDVQMGDKNAGDSYI